MKILSIDNSVVSYIAWYRMHNANFRNVTNSEVAEFTRNYAEIMTYVVELFKADKVFILMDSMVPLWRDKVQLDYYLEHAKAWVDKDDSNKHLLHFDDRYIPLRLEVARGEWIKEKNTTQKDRQVEGWWDQWEETELNEIHIPFVPHYKGNRSKVWNFGTDKSKFKKHANDIAFQFAPFVDAVVLQEDAMEADDIAYLMAKLYPDDEHVMVSSDHDWRQLGVIWDVCFYDPKEHVLVQKEKAQYNFEFYAKLIGGDGGDNVQGSMIMNVKTKKEKKYAEKGAENKLNEIGMDSAWGWMKMNMSPSLKRNILLISLKQGYKYLQKLIDMKKIISDVKNKKVDANYLELKDFNTTEVALRIARQDARRDRVKMESA